MTRAMLEDVPQTWIDEKGRDRLAAVHYATLAELREMLSPDLLNEFDEVMVPQLLRPAQGIHRFLDGEEDCRLVRAERTARP